MIKIKKYNENGDSIVEAIEFDTIEECIAYCEFNDAQEDVNGGNFVNSGMSSSTNTRIADDTYLTVINSRPDLVDYDIECNDGNVTVILNGAV